MNFGSNPQKQTGKNQKGVEEREMKRKVEEKHLLEIKIMIFTMMHSMEGLECKPKLLSQMIKQIDKYLEENTTQKNWRRCNIQIEILK